MWAKKCFCPFWRRSFYLHEGHVWWVLPLIRQKFKKLRKVCTGPWKIKEFRSPLVVKIRHVNKRTRQTVHVDRLIPCLTPQALAWGLFGRFVWGWGAHIHCWTVSSAQCSSRRDPGLWFATVRRLTVVVINCRFGPLPLPVWLKSGRTQNYNFIWAHTHFGPKGIVVFCGLFSTFLYILWTFSAKLKKISMFYLCLYMVLSMVLSMFFLCWGNIYVLWCHMLGF